MSPTGVLPLLVGDLGTPELLIILVVVVLLFGSSKLPELARGSGRALRIFKAETKGLMDDDEPATPAAGAPATPLVPPVPPPVTRPVAPSRSTDADLEARRRDLVARQAELDAERARLHGESAAG